MDRNLDGCYFRVKRSGKWCNICFSDLTIEEQNTVLASRDPEWLKSLCMYLGEQLKRIGDMFDISGKDDACDNAGSN